MHKTRATWECAFSGQRRAYADTTVEGRIISETFLDFWGEYRPFDVSDDQAKRLLKALVGFYEPGEEPHPFAPILRKFEHVGEGIWNVLIVSRYND